MPTSQRDYVPAAGHHWALPLYDPLLRLLGLDALRRPLVSKLAAAGPAKVLDIGCGTGTLAVGLKRQNPGLELVGLDPDVRALAIARAKAARAHVDVAFVEGYCDRLPYADAAFDHVLSSLMFHHLDAETKQATLREVRRVLGSSGRFHLLDFIDEHEHKSWVMRALHSVSGDAALRGQRERGLEQALEAHGFRLLERELKPLLGFGTVAYYVAALSRPAADAAES